MCEYEVEWGKTFGHGVHDIQGFHIVSFMGAFVEGVLPFIFDATFFQAHLLPLIN
jgi:hypothetical protein